MFTLFGLFIGFIAGCVVTWIYHDRAKAKADAVIGAVEK